ncbi:MAG: BlaI/MecI/CopY family transcriptional regulator [Rikenellaceae bacterium]
MNTRELTKAELEVMEIVWEKGEVFLKDVIDAFVEEPKPAYTTVSTIIRILVKKGFLTYKVYGKIHLYSPVVSMEEYSFLMMKKMKARFFGNSFSNMVSFFAKKEDISQQERDEIIELMK